MGSDMGFDEKLMLLRDHVDYHFWRSKPGDRKLLADPNCGVCGGDGFHGKQENEERCDCTRKWRERARIVMPDGF